MAVGIFGQWLTGIPPPLPLHAFYSLATKQATLWRILTYTFKADIWVKPSPPPEYSLKTIFY